jgi:hypothetical protein
MIDDVSEVEQLIMDAWRAADRVSILEVEHIAANAKAIRETLEKLEFALAKLKK